jgi:hypothetical protein
MQHQESRESLTRVTNSRGNSRGGSGRKVDLSNADDGPILEQRSINFI